MSLTIGILKVIFLWYDRYRMNDKLFRKIMMAVFVIGAICTLSLAAYTVYKHMGASLLTYIGNER